LDTEEDPTKQEFEGENYDLVIAANVLHATQHIEKNSAGCASPLETRRSTATAREHKSHCASSIRLSHTARLVDWGCRTEERYSLIDRDRVGLCSPAKWLYRGWSYHAQLHEY
ncbi:hypothetical protein BP00DRAFT_358232, partial [Aspergillus indologenus CBS 114.80]